MAHSAILFDKKKNAPFGRLHVGYRGCDWTKVWYQPAPEAEVDEDGTVEIGLFKLSTGGPTRREPMIGEVVWLPHFDVKVFRATKGAEKERLQMQFLHDAWRYLNEADYDQLRLLEQELEDPPNRQWQSWFEDAKKWKASKFRRRRKRRTARTVAAQTAGIDLGDVEVNSDTSEDSTYESDEDLFVRDKEPMGSRPPMRSGSKRKAGGNDGGGPTKKSPNKSKSSLGGKSKKRSRGSDQDFSMTGGLSGPRRHLGGNLFSDGNFESRTNIPELNDDDENDNASRSSQHSQPWDDRTPEPPSRRAPSRNGSTGGQFSLPGRPATSSAELRDRFRQPAGSGGNEEARAREHNGDVGEDEAMRQAIRASSQQPQNRAHGNQINDQNGENGAGENEG